VNLTKEIAKLKESIVCAETERDWIKKENARLKAQLEAAERAIGACKKVVDKQFCLDDCEAHLERICSCGRNNAEEQIYDYEQLKAENLKAGAGSAVRKDVQVIHGGGSASLIKNIPDRPAVPVELKAGKQESSPATPQACKHETKERIV